MPRPIITLTTDFGTRDAYVGALKGVLLTRCPEAVLVDISHEVAPGAVAEAAWLLESSWTFFPAGTVHLVVVDPGVGTSRRPLAVSCDGQFFVGPDNGVFESLFGRGDACRCHELANPARRRSEVSATFHGRDIFAPAAAFLAAGGALAELGPEVADPVRLAAPELPVDANDTLSGRVIQVDRFGNLVTDIPAERLAAFCPDPARLVVRLAGRRIQGLSTHYAQAPEGEALALVGSHGRLEIAANRASAEILLGGGLQGAVVQLTVAPA